MGNAAPKTGLAAQGQDPRVHLGHDLPKFICQKQIGNGKFMKTFEVKADGVLTVVKVYMQHPNEDVSHYAEKLSQLWFQLNPRTHPNLLPYQIWVQSSARANRTTSTPTYLIRQFMMSNLYDRLSTRPFLCDIEKRWVIYQLFRAVESCHEKRFTHGDIKLENVLVSSWNWVVLTDFAPFKPTYLPDDDPTDYNYYFDVNDRSRCAIALERFCAGDARSPAVDTLNDLKQLDEAPTRRAFDGPCLPSMDVFSLGCAAMEVMMDGEPLLDLPALLQYRAAARLERLDIPGSPVYGKLNKIEDRTLREVLCLMTQKDPNKRKTVAQYREVLDEAGVFPSYFQNLVYQLALEQHTEALTPDDRIILVCRRYSEAITAMTGVVDEQGGSFFQACVNGIAPLFGDRAASLSFPEKQPPQQQELKRLASISEKFEPIEILESSRPAAITSITLSALLTASRELLLHIEAEVEVMRKTGAIPSSTIASDQSASMLAEAAFTKAQDGMSQSNLTEIDDNFLRKLSDLDNDSRRDSSDSANGSMKKRARTVFDGPVLLVQFVCSSIRHVRYPQIRIVSLQLLVRLGLMCSDNILLQRIIPYTVTLLNDPVAFVRAVAVVSLRTLLGLVDTFTAFDASLFPQYIFPALNEVAKETEEIVRTAFVESIGRFAEASKKFLDKAQLMRQLKAVNEQADEKSKEPGVERPTATVGAAVIPLVEGSYDKQLRQLYDQIAKWIRDLLTDGNTSNGAKNVSSLLKRVLLQDMVRLCHFFGQENVEEHLLTQLLTFLNDPDWELRYAFCERIPPLCAFLGPTITAEYVCPCIENALHDAEELVVSAALTSMCSLVELQLLTHQLLLENVKSSIPLLLHPRWCIRQGAIRFVISVCRAVKQADTYALILPLLRPVLTYELIGVDITVDLLSSALEEPVTRREYRRWLQEQSTNNPTHMDPHVVIDDGHDELGDGSLPVPGGANGSEGADVLPGAMDPVNLRRISTPISGYSSKRRANTTFGSLEDGTTSLHPNLSPEEIRRRSIMKPYIDLVCKELQTKITGGLGMIRRPSMMLHKNTHANHGRGLVSDNLLEVTAASVPDSDCHSILVPNQKVIISTTIPDDLRAMAKTSHTFEELRDIRKVFGVTTSAADAKRVALAGTEAFQPEDKSEGLAKIAGATPQMRRTQSTMGRAVVNRFGSDDNIEDPQAKIDMRVDGHNQDPRNLIRRIRALEVPPLPPDLGALVQPDGRKYSGTSEPLSMDFALDSQTRANWRPRQGVIACTFSEHVRSVNRLAVAQDQTFFVSVSDDRTAKVWSLRGMESNVAPRSTLTYAMHKGKVLDVCVCENTHSVASCSDDGSVHVWRVDVEPDIQSDNSPVPGVSVTGTSVIKTIDPAEGPAVNVHHFNNDRASMLVYTTQRGKIHTWDLRADQEPWALDVRPELGYLTSLTLGNDRNWVCAGTSRGYVCLFDIRYHVLAKLWQHSSKMPIHRLASCKSLPKGPKDNIPEDGSYIFVAAGANEAAVWGIPSGGECVRCFRSLSVSNQTSVTSPGPLPILENVPLPGHPNNPISHAVTSLISGPLSVQLSLGSNEHSVRSIMGRISTSGTSYLVTAGTDRHIRFWDFHSHQRSYTIAGTPTGLPRPTYDTPQTEGLHDRLIVCYDTLVPSPETMMAAQLPQREQRGPHSSSHNHRDAVLDLKTLDLPMRMMLSCSRDGEIKAWR